MSTPGVYHPAGSVLHRLPAEAKLLGLLVAAVPVLWLATPPQLGVAAAGILALAGLSRVPPRVLVAQVRPVLWFAVPLLALQWVTAGPARAVVVVGQLVLLVGLAGLVTLTTRVSEMLRAIERMLRPLNRFGARSDRVALVLALAIRCVPLVVRLVGEVRAARRARGSERTPVGFVVPLVIRLLKTADALGEGLAARGVDDGRVTDDDRRRT